MNLRTLSIRQTILYIILTILAIVTVAPFLWMIATSFKHAPDIYTTIPNFLPADRKTGKLYFTLDNYVFVFNYVGMGSAFMNSLFVAIVLIPSKLLLDAIAAYAFARMSFPGKDFLFKLVLTSIMVPGVALLIPRVFVTQLLGMYDTLWALIIPMLLSVWDIFLMRQFFLTLPRELEEAAMIDGASRLRIFWQIILPLSKPVLSVVIISSFIYHWNDLIWPLVTISTPSNYTVPLAVALLNGQVPSLNYTMAGATIAVLPVVIVFLIFQKRILQGIALTGIKG